MRSEVSIIAVRFHARNTSFAIVRMGTIDSSRVKQVRPVTKVNLFGSVACIGVYTVLGMMIHIGKKCKLVDKLIVVFQPQIQNFPERSAFWIVVYSFRM